MSQPLAQRDELVLCTGGTMQEAQYCQDVCVTATVQEEIQGVM